MVPDAQATVGHAPPKPPKQIDPHTFQSIGRAFGLGLGSMMPNVLGLPYLHFLAVGAVGISAMNAATFESLYSAFSRMHVQKTWEAIMNTPVQLHQVVLGEWAWAASKSALSTGAMMVVIALLGVGDWLFWIFSWPLLILGGLMFSALALCVNAKAPTYDFFMFYFTLIVTPMTFLSGASDIRRSGFAFIQG